MKKMTSYKEALFYVMSGTGNTLRVARWMAERAEEAGISSRVVPLAEGRPNAEAGKGRRRLVGLFMPTHGFTAPWHMIRFALRMPWGEGTHAVVVSSCAGSKFGRVFLPGMEGTAGFLIALILLLKGYAVRGVAGVDMPSNWIALHPGFREDNARAIIERARPKATAFIDGLLEDKRRYGRIICLLFGILLLPVSAGYLLYGRFLFAKLFFADNRCNGCGLCARDCPTGAIKMLGKKRPRPYWTYRCESCMHCIAFCPEEAVQAGHSWAVILYFVTSVPAAQYLLGELTAHVPGHPDAGEWTTMLIQYPYFLTSTAAAYVVFNLLCRIPVVDAAFTYTTATRFYRRYHEPDTRLSDITRKGRFSPTKGNQR